MTAASIVAILNVVVSVAMLKFSIRRHSFVTIVWALCTIFAAVMAIESFAAPLYLDFGRRILRVNAEVVHRAVMFAALFNLLSAMAHLVSWRLLPFPSSRGYLFVPQNYPHELRTFLRFALPIMIGAGLIYLRRVMRYGSFEERYSDEASAWEMVVYVACWSVASLSVIFQKRFAMWVAVFLAIILVAASEVRYMALFYVIPILIISWYKRRNQAGGPKRHPITTRSKVLLSGAALSLVGGAVYLGVARGGTYFDSGFDISRHHLPELWLAKGYYNIVAAIDTGSPKTGANSLERLGAGLLYPYLHYFTSYEYPEDPPIYFAELLTGSSQRGIQTWPVLIYADAYAAFGFSGVLLGLFWGTVYSLLDFVLTKRLVFIFMFPYAVWFYYMSFRGAVSNTVMAIPREIYINVLLIVIFSIAFRTRGIWSTPSTLTMRRGFVVGTAR